MALDFPSSPTNGQTFVSGNRTWTYNTTTSSWEASSVATSKTANYVYAAPNGSAGIPDFRALVAADIPTLNQNTTGTAATITGVYSGTITSGQITTGLGFTPYNATNPSGYTSNLGTVTGVTGTAPIVSSGGTAPAISISAATSAAAGSMSAADKTKLDGIATSANNYVLPKATASALGGVEVFDATVQTVAANAVTTTASRTYGVQLNSADQMVVNVPWTNSGGTFDGLTAKTSGTGTYQTTGDFRAPIFYDSNDTGYYIDPNSTTNLNLIQANTYRQNASGVPRVNLGDPTVTEMALFDGQFNNKTEFFPPANVICETSTNGTTWTTYSVTDAQKKLLVGGDSGASISIPNGTAYFRVRFINRGDYVYLNALYAYHTSGGHSTQVQIYKKDFGSTTWVQHTSSTASVGSWPGHIYLPFNTIAYHPGTYVDEVAVVFIPTWNNPTWSAQNIVLHQMQIWGGYPAGKRNIYSVDSDKNVTFPSDVRATLYYDSSDTSYYVDPNSASRLRSVYVTDGTIDPSNVGAGVGLGFINEPTTSFAATGITFGSGTGQHGAIVYGSNIMYFGTENGSDNTMTSKATLNSSGSFSADGDFRAPIFYDTNDTTFYVNPNSTSVMNAIQPWGEVGMRRGDSATLLRSYNTSASQATQFYVNHNLGNVEIGNARGIVYAGGTYWQVANSTRSPIFYDSDDTSRYVDANSTSQIGSTYVNGYFQIQYNSGNQFAGMGIRNNYGSASAQATSFIDFMNENGIQKTSVFGRIATDGAGYLEFLSTAGGVSRSTDTRTTTAYAYSNQWSFQTSAGISTNIVYDRDDTSRYLDINGANVSNINTIFTGVAYFRSNPGSGVYSGAVSSPPLQVYSTDGGSAFMSFHRSGAYAVNLGLDPDNYLRIGGWSASSNRWVLDMSGNNWAAGSFRAPIFYDSDNTTYYIDPNTGSNVFGEFKVNQNGAAGIQLISTTGTQSLWIRTGYDNAPTPSVSATNVQFQSSGYSGGSFTFWSGNTLALTIAGDYAQGNASLRAPIFYDSNNTAFYFDGASTTNINTLSGNGKTALETADGYLRINQGSAFSNGIWTGSSNFLNSGGILGWGSNGGTTNSRVYINGGTYNGTNVISLDGSNGRITASDIRAPIFYDTDNTGYYINAHSDSNIYRLFSYLGGRDTNGNWNTGFQNTPAAAYNFHGDISSGGPAGSWWFYESMRHSNATNYWGTQIAWGWEDNATRLMQRNVTNGSFGGWVEYLNTSDRTYNGNLYMTGSIRSTSSDMRAPVFYDQDNTGYYINAAGTSYINALNIGPTAAGSSYLNINGYNAYGGTGYHGFLTVSNTYGSATNPNQYWRINGAGGFEIVNSPYNAVLFTFTQGGDFTAAGNVTAYSDRKLKDNFESISDAIQKVMQLNGVTFTRIDKEDTATRYAGLIAQDVEAVLPEAVQINETISYGEVKSVDYNATIALLVEAIKEQQSHITKLEEKLNKLLGE